MNEEYKNCQKCGQKTTIEAKNCPVCKAEFPMEYATLQTSSSLFVLFGYALASLIGFVIGASGMIILLEIIQR